LCFACTRLELAHDALLFSFCGPRDDVAGEVDDLFEVAAGDAEHHRQARRDAAQEPDVRDRHCQVDMAHALAAHDGARDFDAALLADNALVADAAVFAAVTFVVFFRTEDLFVEEEFFSGRWVR
jgi:hypothetical protein